MKNSLRLGSIATLVGALVVMAAPGAQASSAKAKHEEKVDVNALTKRAYDGNANAQYALASLYEQGGSGVKKDLSYAISWYEEAAHNGLYVAAEKLKNLSNTP